MKIKTYLSVFIIMVLTTAQSLGQSFPEAGKILVVYFSHSGNTGVIAQQIQHATGGDIFKIEPVKPYPAGYQAVVDQARKEINSGYRPELAARMADISKYDVIFVGSPCWWATIAPPVATFLSGYDWSGKTVVPFMTHEGSRMGHSEADIRGLCSGATVLDGFPVRGSQVKTAEGEVIRWLREIKMIR